MKTGLVLEGGAMRGMFTCGVIDVLMENGIEFDGAAGISAGAIFGCNYKSKQIGRGVRYNKKYGKDPRYCSVWSLVFTGDLYNEEFCYHKVLDELDPLDKKTYKENPMDFFVGAVDINTGKCEYHNCLTANRDDIKWMQASASMPLVSKPVRVDGHLLLDGGMVDSIPYKILEKNGYEREVIVLTQPEGYVKKKSSSMAFIKMVLRKYPELIKAMEVRHRRYNAQIRDVKEREDAGKAFVIRPPYDLGISRTENNPDELERVYQIGREEMKKQLPELIKFLNEKN